MSMSTFDPSRGVHVKGIPLTATSFLAVTNFNQLQTITRHPADLQPAARVTGYDAETIAEEAQLHELIQRALTGNKKANVGRYSSYIEEVVVGAKSGVLPPLHLWSLDELDIVPLADVQYAVVPNGQRLLAIDGETQLTAHYELRRRGEPETREAHGRYPLAAVIHHKVPIEMARQYFHDLNVLAVRPNTSLGLSMNSADPVMQVVAEVEQRVSFINGRVERMARQLAKSSPKVITMQALRQMVVNVAKGIAGVQYGARPVPVDGIDLGEVTDVAVQWFELFFGTFHAEVSDREDFLIGSSVVLSAVGAMGNVLLNTSEQSRPAVAQELIASLREVDWRKGGHWQGIAGRFSPKGLFTVSGTKEVGYAVFNVLTDRQNPGFAAVRSASVDGAAAEPTGSADQPLSAPAWQIGGNR
jgi:DNA sulfur modification protein DndB